MCYHISPGCRRDHMKTVLYAYASLALLSGCASQPAPTPQKLPDPQAIQTTFSSRLTPPVSGTFTVSYAPRDFAEPADVRAARDQYIRSRIILALTQAGMTYKDLKDPGDADYEVSYSYSTSPTTVSLGLGFDKRGEEYLQTASGFSQSFSITINKNPMGRLWHPTPGARMPLDRDMAQATGTKDVPWENDYHQWSGDAEIACWPYHDITDLFPRFIHALLDDFPRN